MDVLSQALTAARTGHPVSYRVDCRPPWGRAFPSVPGVGFHVVLEGSVWLIARTGRPVPLGVGDVVVFPHGHGHAMADRPDTPLLPMSYVPEAVPDDDRRTTAVGPDGSGAGGAGAAMLCGMYRLTRERAHPLLAGLPEMIHLPARLGRHNHLRSTIDLLADELRRPGPGSHVATTALIDLLLVHLLRGWYESTSTAGWAAALTDPAVSAALRAIHAEPARPWKVEGLAALSGVSRASFARRFKDLTSQGPLSYVTWWRLTLAANLLRGTDAPIATVARQVGYTSEFAFANAFKREYGTAPGRYRRPEGAEGA
ncbi:AraC family transcriptional regulator [Micromonospora sp. NPDC049559]|uniref:AraC family transcriptional regulator n=1 Tax=Micromonospora sp. NPDC049559 TaxID=3155923 RepID=UPI003427F495